jgi:hypothetical protein
MARTPAYDRRAMTLILLALLPLLTAADATRTDFSGTWERVDAEPEVPTVAATGDVGFRSGTMGSGWGSPLTIRQDASSLVVEYPQFSAYDLQPPLRFTYALDGSESRNSVMIGHTTSRQISRVAWRDRSLVITTEFPAPVAAGHVAVRQALTLESAETLQVETTRDGLDGAPPSVTRTTWTKRQKPPTASGARD